jgi:hypothetical protein
MIAPPPDVTATWEPRSSSPCVPLVTVPEWRRQAQEVRGDGPAVSWHAGVIIVVWLCLAGLGLYLLGRLFGIRGWQ